MDTTNTVPTTAKKADDPDRASPPTATEASTTFSHTTAGGQVSQPGFLYQPLNSSNSNSNSNNNTTAANNNNYNKNQESYNAPFDESVTSLFMEANSEAFSAVHAENCSIEESSVLQDQGSMTMSILTVEEAGGIVERHIANHPIQSEHDFHYIADLLRNYENDDDLRRVAELLRANESKKKKKTINGELQQLQQLQQQQQQQHHSENEGNDETNLLGTSKSHRKTKTAKKKSNSKKKKQKKKKHKRSKMQAEDDQDDTYNDEGFSLSSSSSTSTDDDEDSSSSDQSDSGRNSYSSISVSMNSHEHSQIQAERNKKEQKRLRKEHKRNKQERKEWKKRARKEEKERRERERQAQDEHDLAADEEVAFLASKIPPKSVEVVHSPSNFRMGAALADSVSTTTNDVAITGRHLRDYHHRYHSDTSANDSDINDDNHQREVFHNETNTNSSSTSLHEEYVDEPDSESSNGTRSNDESKSEKVGDSFVPTGLPILPQDEVFYMGPNAPCITPTPQHSVKQIINEPAQLSASIPASHEPTLTTIFSSKRPVDPLPMKEEGGSDAIQEYELGLGNSTSRSDYNTAMNGANKATKQGSVDLENLDVTARTDYVAFQSVAAEESSTYGASLGLDRATSNPLLNTALHLSKHKLGKSVSTLSASVFQTSANRQTNASIISGQELTQLRETLILNNNNLAAREFNSSMVTANAATKSAVRGIFKNPAHTPRTTEGGKVAGNNVTVKPRLLCLHDWRSNADITRLQLENLGLSDFFEPTFIEGPHTSSRAADAAVDLLSEGPYCSWVDQIEKLAAKDNYDNQTESRSTYFARYLQNNVQHELTATTELISSLQAVMMHLLGESKYMDTLTMDDNEPAVYDAVYGFGQGAALATLLSFDFVRNAVLNDLNLPPMKRLPWKFVVSACATNTSINDLLAKHLGFEFTVQIPLPSIHIIGLLDSLREESKAMMKDYYDEHQAFPIYLDSGHDIPATTRKLTHILDEILNWFLIKIPFPDIDVAKVPVELESQQVSMVHVMDEVNKIHKSRVHERSPIADVDMDVGHLHVGKHGQYIINTDNPSHSNMIEMLEAADPKQIAFFAPATEPLTYSALLDFIRGDGDLRRCGAQEGFTVAYVSPYGAVGAVAFVTIAAQCTAAPLNPESSESDYLLALEQIQPDLVITFDGVDFPLVHKVALGHGFRVAHAATVKGKCGLFSFRIQVNITLPTNGYLDPTKRLVNHVDGTGLILRTNGTPSRPKVVPLKLGAIVASAHAMAKNLDLQKSDIALNAMPLFVIGGISANLLPSLAAGASVILLPRFSAPNFFDHLTALEEARPTWFSAVPTMLAAIDQSSENSVFKTALKFIRSDADTMPQDLALKMERAFNCPMILAYSVTEQFIISQSPRGDSITRNKPNSVGQPVCVSMCIVDDNFRPVMIPNHVEVGDTTTTIQKIDGEICISGPMIFEGYVANHTANKDLFFRMGGMEWFRTGDVGHLDKDGFVYLTARSKDLIRRGDEHVTPDEVEEAIYKHEDVKTAVVFPVPDPICGQKIGAAVVLKHYSRCKPKYFKKDLHRRLLADNFPKSKMPDQVLLVSEDDLPNTQISKDIRWGLARKLGMASTHDLKEVRPVNYHEAAVGVKFILAFAILYDHIGNFDNRDLSEYSRNSMDDYGWEHTRSFSWHFPILFLVNGFLLAAGTHTPALNLKDLSNFYCLRIAGLYPMYLISVLFCTINFAIRCNPSNFIPDFERLREPEKGEYFVCQATPIEWSYAPTLITSIISYACTLQSWPMMIPFSWFLSYCTWYSSVYVFCIFFFPWCHQQYHAVRNEIVNIWRLNFFWLGMHYLYVLWLSLSFGIADEALQNYFSLSSYIFPPGWFPCCALGVGCFYLFRHYRPNEMSNAWVWGATTDIISLLLFAGWLFYGLAPEASTPNFALDDMLAHQHWDLVISRILAPIGFLWFWGLAVGTGYTSVVFSRPVVVEWLAPASYNIILFHQPLLEWYYLATRGEWWAYPKSFYWFSPYAYPVEIWEFFIVAAIVVGVSVIMEAYVNEFLVFNFSIFLKIFQRKSDTRNSVLQIVQSIIRKLTDATVVEGDTGLKEAGLSSMTKIILTSEIKKVYKMLKLTVHDVTSCETVGELVAIIEGRIQEAIARPELAPGKRTAVVSPNTLRNAVPSASSDFDDEKEGDFGSDFRNHTFSMDHSSDRYSQLDRATTTSHRSNLGGRSRHACFVIGDPAPAPQRIQSTTSSRKPPHRVKLESQADLRKYINQQ